jgi:hypothetical protein
MIKRQDTRFWKDQCNHPADSYVGSFELTTGDEGTDGKYDVYMYPHRIDYLSGLDVCIRYGDEGREYISPGELYGFVKRADDLGSKMSNYKAAADLIREKGRFKLTERGAKTILECFGPCTQLYECTSVEDLIEEFDEGKDPLEKGTVHYRTVHEFIRDLLTSEDVYQDRSADAAYHVETGAGPEGHHKKVVDELDETMFRIKMKLRDYGLLPEGA